jgi:hypothetical protein
LTSFLTRYGLEYEIVPYRPFTDDIPVKTERKDVWFFGSINAGKVFRKRQWNPGIIFNENFDFDVYLKHYGDWLLNKDAKIQEFDHIRDWRAEEYFIRPTHDTKSFESNMYTEEQWNQYVHEVKESGTLGQMRAETKVLYASVKRPIQQEIRCWVLDGKMVTCSQYRIGNRVNMLNLDNAGDIPLFIRDMCKIYTPARAFCMDICLYEDEYRIVELGCINHCGFYDADMSKLIQSLENTFGHGLSTGIPTTDPARTGKTG